MRKKDIVKVWYFFEKYGFDLWPKLSHNVTTLDNTDIAISMSHVLLFPKIYNLAVCHTIKANRQQSIPCYPTINISCQHESHIQDLDLEHHMFGLFLIFNELSRWEVIVRLVDFGRIVMLTISLLKLSFHSIKIR